jgi:ATP-dependent Clp protease ATP-binding subunit ClpA
MIEATKSAAVRSYLPDGVPDLGEALAAKLVGQPDAIDTIVPYVRMYQANLAPAGRPVGVFLLLGPTGTGKTRTVESLAAVLHGSEKKLLKIDCGEFQMEHEVARLVGAPPGYLGHRETQPMITQQKLNAATSERCGLSLVLFDEIEKAASSLGRLLLGVLDKGILHLGDNTAVNFENSLIFLTSNLGAREMMREIRPEFGFPGASGGGARAGLARKLERIGMVAVRKKFSPEFVNRIDAVITYQPLDAAALGAILDQQLEEFQSHVHSRLGADGFSIEVSPEGRQYLLREGTSAEYGARELKRTLHRQVIQPMAAMVAAGAIQPGCTVRVTYCEASDALAIEADGAGASSGLCAAPALARRMRRSDKRGERDTLRLTA